MSAKVDLTGQRFGRLVVIKELPRKTALRKTLYGFANVTVETHAKLIVIVCVVVKRVVVAF